MISIVIFNGKKNANTDQSMVTATIPEINLEDIPLQNSPKKRSTALPIPAKTGIKKKAETKI